MKFFFLNSLLNYLYKLTVRFYRILRGRDLFIFKNHFCSTTCIGEKYNNWTYNHKIIDSNSVVYSLGIGYNISFDRILIEKHNCIVHAFDPTPGVIDWLKSQELPEKYHYYQYGISDRNDPFILNIPEDRNYSGSAFLFDESINKVEVQGKNIPTILKELGHKKIDILKMDIEGFEYKVIDQIIEHKIPVKQLLVEFHHRFRCIGKSKTIETVKKLEKVGFKIFNISLLGEEYSFINTKL